MEQDLTTTEEVKNFSLKDFWIFPNYVTPDGTVSHCCREKKSPKHDEYMYQIIKVHRESFVIFMTDLNVLQKCFFLSKFK